MCILYRTPCYCLISVPEVEHGGGNENKSVILSSVVKLLREEYDNTAVGFQCRLSAHWQPQCYDRNKSQIQPGNRAWKYQCNDLWRNLYISLLINKVCVSQCTRATRRQGIFDNFSSVANKLIERFFLRCVAGGGHVMKGMTWHLCLLCQSAVTISCDLNGNGSVLAVRRSMATFSSSTEN